MKVGLERIREIIAEPDWSDSDTRDGAPIYRAAGRGVLIVYKVLTGRELVVITILPRTQEHYTRPDAVV